MNRSGKTMKSLTALVLSFAMFTPTLASCGKKKPTTETKSYTYTDAFLTTPNTWNPHTYRTTDDSYPMDFTYSSLYEFFFNDDRTGYEIKPVMAAAEPVDVTTELKSETKWGIPASAEKGYAYKISLNPNAKWDDGTPINADTYVESMKLLLDPNYANYRAANYYSGDLVIKNAKGYSVSGLHAYKTGIIDGDSYTGYFNMPTVNYDPDAPTLEYDEAGKAWVTIAIDDEETASKHDIGLYLTDGGVWGDALEDYYTYSETGGYLNCFYSDYFEGYYYKDADGNIVRLTEEQCGSVEEKTEDEKTVYYYGEQKLDGKCYTLADDGIDYYKELEKAANAKGEIVMTKTLIGYLQTIVARMHGYEDADDYAAAKGSYDDLYAEYLVEYYTTFATNYGETWAAAWEAMPDTTTGTGEDEVKGKDAFTDVTYKIYDKTAESWTDKTGVTSADEYVAYKSYINAANYADAYATQDSQTNDYAYVEWQEFCYYGKTYDTVAWEDVGIYKSGEYEFTIVFEKSLTGFYLLYNLNSPWIVNVEEYKKLYTQDPITGVWNSTYNTSVETSYSCGPYKLTTFEDDKLMVFERNENWFGYSDEKFEGLYQTTTIRSTYVPEASTRKSMFLKGELMTYGLQAEDYADYRTSDYFYSNPGTTIFFLVLYGNEEQLKKAEAKETGVNKTILANDDFREALSLCFDKDAFAAKISPARSGAYSVIGSQDIWNPTTGEKYRDTEVAKKALVEYYGFIENEDGTYGLTGSTQKYSLDQAVDAITGYNPERAKEKFLKAFADWTAAGKYNEGDVVKIEYAISSDSEFMTKTINELNEKINSVLAGTAYEGKVQIVKSAPLGGDWSTALRTGQVQTCLCGWNGGMLNPFGTMMYYTYPDYDPYAEEWWDTESEELTLTLPVGTNGADVTLTMSLTDWTLCLNGDAMKIDGVEYNFGYEQVADEVRLTIMAEIEKAILATNYYIPLLQDGSGFLLTKKAQYVLGPDDYNAVLGRGGIMYMTYIYDDAEWDAYVKSQNGTINYN